VNLWKFAETALAVALECQRDAFPFGARRRAAAPKASPNFSIF
jgi:hypothetical protein